MALSVLVVDANSNWREHARLVLEFMEYDVHVAASPDELNGAPTQVAAVFLGHVQDDQQCLEQVQQLKAQYPDAPLILMNESASGQPLTPKVVSEVSVVAGLPLRHGVVQALLDNIQPKPRPAVGMRRSPQLFRSLVGDSPGIASIRHLIEQVANSEASVLILGESGTGKEVVARKLHYFSSRRGKPFVPVNCGAIPSELLESELFGHEKGASTGAISARQGRFELAEGGTLFLDEISDMSPHMQVKLLRVLRQRVFERVGSNRSIRANVRVIAATHRNLKEAIKDGKFREDLFNRLNASPIEMPPLRDRREDIPLLIEELILRYRNERRVGVRLTRAAIDALTGYSWPGNVRELAGLIERLTILQPHGTVDAHDLPARYVADIKIPAASVADSTATEVAADPASLPRLPREGLDIKEHLNTLEYTLIKQALDEAGGVVAHAAERLRLRRTTLVEKLRKYGLSRGSEEASGF